MFSRINNNKKMIKTNLNLMWYLDIFGLCNKDM